MKYETQLRVNGSNIYGTAQPLVQVVKGKSGSSIQATMQDALYMHSTSTKIVDSRYWLYLP